MPNRRDALMAGLAAGVAGGAAAASEAPAGPAEELDLWPGQPPGAPPHLPVEQAVETGGARRLGAVRGIGRPRMSVFRPARPNGAAMLVMPGGGYAMVMAEAEGRPIGAWLAARGWTVFVLRYRLPGEGWADRADAPLADAQRAMRVIRSRASAFGVDPGRLGALGFSAGGHLCGELATRHGAEVYAAVDGADRLSARPAVAAPIYAVQSMSPPLALDEARDLLLGPSPTPAMERAHSPARNVGASTPPFFMAHAEDDRAVSVENTVEMRAALKSAGVEVETHLFAAGGHGFSLPGPAGDPARRWPELFVSWARAQGLA